MERTRSLIIGHIRPALYRMGEVLAREQVPEPWVELLDRIDETERERKEQRPQGMGLATRKDRRGLSFAAERKRTR
jgi:hypothetical protein